MLLNSKQREEPYLGLNCRDYLHESGVRFLVEPIEVLHGCRQLVS